MPDATPPNQPTQNEPQPGRFDRIRRIFAGAMERPADERSAFLDHACAGDADLRHEVDSLLHAARPTRTTGQIQTGGAAAALGTDVAAAAGAVIANPTKFATAPLTEKPGTIIGPYKLLEAIGEGGFGTVFLADQTAPVRRRVALKVIKLGMDTKQVVARFEAERQALALMDHPNIAKVFDAGATESGRPYFVMEYVKGDPITLFADAHRLTLRERLEVLMQVCNAVQHAHQKGVIHRDIKPSNVLVSMVDGKPLAKVIDFGIAKATGAAGGTLTDKTLFTEHRALIGTPEYMSPEQAEGSPDIDTRTDVYGLGVLMYELLTGTTPFESSRLHSAARAEIERIIREEEPPSPSLRITRDVQRDLKQLAATAARRKVEPEKLNALMRGELDWITMKAIDKDRGRRFSTPQELAADVDRHLRGEAVVAAPPSAAYRVRKFVRKNKGSVLTIAAIAVTLMAGIAATTWQWTETRRANARLTNQNRGVIEALTELVRTLQLVEPDITSGHYTLADGRDVTIVRRKGKDWKTDVRILPGRVAHPESALDAPQPEIDPDFAMRTLALIIEDNSMKMYDQTVMAKSAEAEAKKQAAIAEANAAESRRQAELAIDAAEFAACGTYLEETASVTLSRTPTPGAMRHLGRIPKIEAMIFASSRALGDETLRLLSAPDSPLKTVTSLELYESAVTDDGMKYLSAEAGALKSLTSLSLWDTKVSDVGLKELARPDSALRSLTVLNLGSTQVTSAGVSALARADTGLRALTELDLSLTNVTDDGVKHLACPDTGLKRLTTLSLRGTHVTNAGLKEIAATNSGILALNKLDLSQTKITDEGMKYLARADTGLKVLIELDLSSTIVTDEGVKGLANTNTSLRALTSLNLRATKVTDVGVKELSRADTGLNALTSLSLSYTSVTDAAARYLAHPNTGLKSLTKLDLSSTSVTDEGVIELARANTALKALTSLDISSTKVTDSAVQELSRADTGLKGLSSLSLSYTQVTDDGITHLASPGTGLKSLTTLFLWGENVSNTGAATVKSRFPGIKIYR